MLLPLVTATFCSKLWTIIYIMCVHFTQINKQDICTRVIKKRFFFSLFSLGVGGVDGGGNEGYCLLCRSGTFNVI